MSLAKLRLSPHYGKLAKFQASDEGLLTLKEVPDADMKMVKQICVHLDLVVEKKDDKVVIKKPGHDFFESLDIDAPDAKDQGGLSGYVARGDLIGAEKLASRGTVSQANLFTALLALPQAVDLKASMKLLTSASATAPWPSEEAKRYFEEKARQATLFFLAEGREKLEAAKNKDTDALVRSGLCQLDVMLTDGRVKGEIQVSTSNSFMDRRNEREEVVPQGRGILVGDCVSIRPMDGGHMTECEVVVAAPLILRPLVAVPPGTTGSGRQYRVDSLANRQQFTRTLTAVHLSSAPASQDGNMTKDKDRRRRCGLPGKHRPSDGVLNVLFGNTTKAAKVQAGKRIAKAQKVNDLNASQRRALNEAAFRCFTLVQGPPGTGKTTVSIRILKAWADARRGRVLCASDSNIAVDNVVEGLANLGVNVVRVGRPEAARPEVLEHCADELALKSLDIEKKDANKDSKLRELVKQAVQQSINEADVVCCTAIGAGTIMLNEQQFVRVLVDEAAQATELATLVPICRGSEQVVLCGDQCQLPPTIGVDSIRDEGLEISLFERLTRVSHKPHVLLEAQHRMHPAISAFPRAAFYGGRLTDGISSSDREPPRGFRWPNKDMPLCFVSTRGSERREGDSFRNDREADKVVEVVQDLLNGGLLPPQVGVVTPYAAQVRLVRTLLVRAGLPTSRERNGVETNSVDGYQGREKEAIVISTVRSSAAGGLGFVADWRRANVAFTRARRGLIVIGDADTLGREPATWARWLTWVKRTGCYKGSLSYPPKPKEQVEAVGLAGQKDPETLLEESADSWVKGRGEKETRKRDRSESCSQADESSDTGDRSPCKKRRVAEVKDEPPAAQDAKKEKDSKKDKKSDKKKQKKMTKKDLKKEKKRLKKEKKRLKKQMKESDSSDSSSSS